MNVEIHPRCFPLLLYFGTDVTAEDYTRLGPHLSSWEHLNQLLVLGQFPLSDLKRLLVLELCLYRRKQFLSKLRSRIATAESNHIKNLIDHALTVDQRSDASHLSGRAVAKVDSKPQPSRKAPDRYYPPHMRKARLDRKDR